MNFETAGQGRVLRDRRWR